MTRIAATSLLILAAAFALSCGGKDSAAPAQSTIEGTFDDGAVPSPTSKALMAATASYEGEVIDPVSGATIGTVTITGKSYKTTVNAGSNLRIKIKKNGVEILSRLMPGATTAVSVTNVNVNAVTTVQAKMMAAAVQNGDYGAALTAVNTALFGTATVKESELTLTKIATVNASFAARVAVYAQAVSGSTLNTDVVNDLSGVFEAATVSAVVTKYVQAVDAIANNSSKRAYFVSVMSSVTTNPTVASALGSATLTSLIKENDSLKNDIYSAIQYAPYFASSVDSARTAAPGALFQYTFPTASTSDIQGLSGYSGAWSSTPNGVAESTNSGRTIKLLPAQADVGKTYTYTLTATGANGKTATSQVSVAVKSTEIKGVMRKQLAGGTTSANGKYQPVQGPQLLDGYIYLVSRYSATDLYRLEKYDAAAVTTGSDLDSLTLARSWDIPSGTGAIYDLAVSGGKAYLATANSGVIGYDLSIASSSPDYAASSMTATYIATLGSYVYALNDSSFSATRASLTLTDASAESSLTTKANQIGATSLRTYGSYLYLTSSYTNAFYNPATAAWTSNFTAAYKLSGLDGTSDIATTPLYLSSLNTATQFSNGSLASTSLSGLGLLANTFENRISNGPWGFAMAMTPTSVYGYSLVGTANSAASSDDSATGALRYTNCSDDLRFVIRNIPEGITTNRSGAYLYTLGQYTATGTITSNSATMTGTWYIKAFKAQPSE